MHAGGHSTYLFLLYLAEATLIKLNSDRSSTLVEAVIIVVQVITLHEKQFEK